MKILLITKEYLPFKGGVANYYHSLTENFPDKENFFVIDNNKKELDKDSGFFSWRVSFSNVYKKIKKEGIDKILVGQILPLGSVAFFLSFITPIRYDIFFHGLDLSLALKPGRKKFLSKLIIKKADKLIAANSFVASILSKEFPEKKNNIKVVNPGLSISNYNFSFDKQFLIDKYKLKNKKVLFSLGRLVKRKGFDNTIKALEKMEEVDLSDLVYFIAGNGPEKEYLKNMIPKKLESRIIILDEISDQEKMELLFLADIFIMPARNIAGDYEGFGIVYLEANLFSKPVIAGLSGGVSDAVVNNLNGILIDPENIDEIKEAILKLKKDESLRLRLGKQGRERVLLDFSWEKIAKDLFDFIKN